jgi:dTDP-4-dehydrorhamnose reductase
MTKVLILGNNGMLGHAVESVLRNAKDLNVSTTSRSGEGATFAFDVKLDDIKKITNHSAPDFIVNCIGAIKPRINVNSAASINDAIFINSTFPHQLLAATKDSKARIIQIATDCVFSGTKGGYLESDLHDATDVYGKTKSLGEVSADNFFNLRASIVGPEKGRATSLLEWFINQSHGAKLNGFANHMWNGISTYQFAKISLGIIHSETFVSGMFHLIPADSVSKYELLKLFKTIYKRIDIQVTATFPEKIVDRTLSTENILINKRLWNDAGYKTAPFVEEMLLEMQELSQILKNN